MILLDGVPKSGKSCMAYELSASDKVGRTFVFPIGERSADEYQSLGPYEIVDLTQGTWAEFYGQLIEATKVPMIDGKPNVIILDTATSVWGSLADWANLRARRSKRAQKLLADDPDADIDTSSVYWNDAKDRWAHMIKLLTEWEGITVLVARGDEVTEFKNGQPVPNSSVYRAQVEKTTPYNVTANVRLASYRSPRLMMVTQLGVTVPSNGLELPKDNTLEHLIFEVMGVTAGNRQPSTPVTVTSGEKSTVSGGEAKQAIAAVFTAAGFSPDELKAPALAVWHAHYPKGVQVAEVSTIDVDIMVDEAKELIEQETPPEEPTEPVATTEPVGDPIPHVGGPPVDEAAAFLQARGIDVDGGDVPDSEPDSSIEPGVLPDHNPG